MLLGQELILILFKKLLKKLYARGESGIDDASLSGVNLFKLNANNNTKITNINHLSKLQILHASSICGIDNAGIQDLDLVGLNVQGNKKIYDILHLSRLERLSANGSGISDTHILKWN